MRANVICLLILTAVCSLPRLKAQNVIHCWDFTNGGLTEGSNRWPSPLSEQARLVGNGTITHNFTNSFAYSWSQTEIDLLSTTSTTPTLTPNSCPDSQDSYGTAFGCASEANNGNSFILAFPTTGYENIVLSFDSRRTSTGFSNNTLAYTTDGVMYNNFYTFDTGASNWKTDVVNFSSIEEANDNPLFAVRITLGGAVGTQTNRNARFDNIKMTGAPVSVIVPIRLTSFKANLVTNGRVQLDWITATEEGNAYMVVERSADGRSFYDIGRVSGRGYSQSPLSYQFVDEAPRAGINYYRLRQVDFDGSYHYHNVVSVSTGGGESPLSIYPNPTTGTLYFSEALPLGASVAVYDMLGRLKQQLVISQENADRLQLALLTPGAYILRWEDGAKGSQTLRFIRQ